MQTPDWSPVSNLDGAEVELRPIPGWEGLYSATACGKIFSHERTIYLFDVDVSYIKKAQWMRQQINPQGYLTVNLRKNGRSITKSAHRLITLAWIQNNDPEKTCVNHIDANRTNNNISNLEWCTYSENIKHSFRIGSRTNTEKMKAHLKNVHDSMKKLSQQQANEIRERVKNGGVQRQIAKEIGISTALVSQIVNNQIYI